jgi:hypothetical protein
MNPRLWPRSYLPYRPSRAHHPPGVPLQGDLSHLGSSAAVQKASNHRPAHTLSSRGDTSFGVPSAGSPPRMGTMSRNPSGAQTTEAIGVERTLPSVQLLLREPVTPTSFLNREVTVPDRSKDCRLAAYHPSLGVRRRQIVHRTCYRCGTRLRHFSVRYRLFTLITTRRHIPELQDQFVSNMVNP